MRTRGDVSRSSRKVFIILIIVGLAAVLISVGWDILIKPAAFKQGVSTGTLYVYCKLKRPAGESNARDGEYLLEVKGVVGKDNSKNALNNKETAIKLVVIPRFWETWWFKLLSAVFVLGILFALYAAFKAAMKYLFSRRNHQAEMNRLFSKYNLSRREQEIALLMFRGATNKSIQHKLFISSHTVKNHIYNIYRKVGIRNRLQFTNLIQDFQG
jgi:DNA-binding CsgD family transcriptional regulator